MINLSTSDQNTIRSQLMTLQSTYTATDDKPVQSIHDLVASYNAANPTKMIDGETARALLGMGVSKEIQLDPTQGFYTRTIYDTTTGKIKLTNNTLFSSSAPTYSVSGGTIVVNGDYATLNSPSDTSDTYFYEIFNQNNSTTPITIRFKASGTNNAITSPESGSWGFEFNATYTTDGLSGDKDTFDIPFPTGTFTEQTFELHVVPRLGVQWCYLYIFARYHVCSLTIRDIEIFLDGEDNLAPYGDWESEVVDLYAQQNRAIETGSIVPEKFGFSYTDCANVGGFSSTEYSKSYLENFDYIALKPPGQASADETLVFQYLTSKGVKLFGYVYLGSTADTPAMSDSDLTTNIDAMAAAGYYGVFFDMSGYDYNVTRARLNTWVDYAHSKSLKAMVNAWRPTDVLLSTIDATNNPTGVATHLGTGDWVLHESFYSSSDNNYIGQSGGTIQDFIDKYSSTSSAAKPLGVKVSALAYAASTMTPTQSVHDQFVSYVLAAMTGCDGWTYSLNGLDICEYVRPNIQFGSTITTPITYVGNNRWETITDQGVLWFEAPDLTTHFAGAYDAITPLDVEKPPIFQTMFKQPIKDAIWYTSIDNSTWRKWDTGSPDRFVKVRVYIQH